MLVSIYLSAVENSKLREHQTAVEVQLAECTAQYQRLQDKHKTLTEYFEQKEHSLHRLVLYSKQCSIVHMLWCILVIRAQK